MTTAGATEELDFKSSSGYAALIVMFIALVAIPVSVMMRMQSSTVLWGVATWT